MTDGEHTDYEPWPDWANGHPDQWPTERPIYFDRQGQPMSRDEYVYTFDEETWEKTRRVGQDVVIIDDEPCNVSTVWVGIDMGFIRRPGGRPIIFETMVFGGPYDQSCMRYATELEAQEGHARTVNDLMTGQVPWFEREDEDADSEAQHRD
jgi:hypothetical protein